MTTDGKAHADSCEVRDGNAHHIWPGGEKREKDMTLHAPSVSIFVVSLVFAVLALIGHVVLIPFVTLYGFWVAIIAYVILAVGVVMRS
jgi:hypothetical protein